MLCILFIIFFPLSTNGRFCVSVCVCWLPVAALLVVCVSETWPSVWHHVTGHWQAPNQCCSRANTPLFTSLDTGVYCTPRCFYRQNVRKGYLASKLASESICWHAIVLNAQHSQSNANSRGNSHRIAMKLTSIQLAFTNAAVSSVERKSTVKYCFNSELYASQCWQQTLTEHAQCFSGGSCGS